MNVCILGSSGQLGASIHDEFSCDKSYKVFSPSSKKLDLSDHSKVDEYFKNKKFDFVINCAAYTNVDDAEDNREIASSLNSKLPDLLARLSSIHKFTFFHFSTDYVFDGESNLPYSEDNSGSPINFYGKSKYIGDQCVQSRINEGSSSIIFRVSWVYSDNENNFVIKVLRNLIKGNNLKIVSDQIGTPCSTFFIAEIVKKVTDLLNYRKVKDPWGIYNLVPDGETSWHSFALFFIDKFCKRQKINFPNIEAVSSDEYDRKASRPMSSRLNNYLIKKTFLLDLPFWFDDFNKHSHKIFRKVIDE